MNKIILSPNIFKNILKPNMGKYALCINLEINRLEGDKMLRPREIVEFPIVVYDINEDTIDKKFHYYCKPDLPITKYCTKISGITQEKVDNEGLEFSEVFEKCNDWFKDNDINYNNSFFVTCGAWHLKTALREQCQYSGIRIPILFNQWCNLRHIFYMYESDRLEERYDTGIKESYSIARCVQNIYKNKQKLSITENY